MDSKISSGDGTTIAYDRSGAGSPIVLVGGGLTDRHEHDTLAVSLASDFDVVNYDRRGRGASSNALPYELAREIDDLAALVESIGEPVGLFGASSGGALALEAAAAGLAVKDLAVYEVPYMVEPEAVALWQSYRMALSELLADGRNGDAVAAFMALAGAPPDDIDKARTSAVWRELEAIAPTLAYDAACLDNGRPPIERLRTITCRTLVATAAQVDPHLGGLAPGFFDSAADAISSAVPNAARIAVETGSHVAGTEVAAALRRFFAC